MIPLRIITYFQNNEPIKWGIQLHKVTSPLCIVVHSKVADFYETIVLNKNTEILVLDIETPFFFSDTLKIIAYVNTYSKSKAYNSFYIQDTYLYQNISLELFYQPILVDYILSKNYIGYYFNNYYHYGSWLFTISNIHVFKFINELKEAEVNFGLNNKTIVSNYLSEFDKKYSDFNLQVSELIYEKVLHIIGDSHVFTTLTPNHLIACRSNILYHSKHYFKQFELPYIYTHHLGSKTLYGFCKQEEDMQKLVSDLCIKANDTSVFVLGEIDIRSHIFKYCTAEITFQNILDELIANYGIKLIEIKNIANVSIIIMGAIPPMDGPKYNSDEYPIVGCLEDRVEATQYFNIQLKKMCLENDFKYFEVNHFYSLPDGSLNLQFSDLFCHINSHYNFHALNLLAQTIQPEASYIINELAL